MNKTAFHKIKSFAIPLLALLLLVAPCSVRNQLETSLGLRTSKPLNPLKTTASQSSFCAIWQNTSEKENASSSKKQAEIKISVVKTVAFFSTSENQDTKFLVINKGSNWTPPYYILYKRLKIFDLNATQTV